jgi:hypothetical protein
MFIVAYSKYSREYKLNLALHQKRHRELHFLEQNANNRLY